MERNLIAREIDVLINRKKSERLYSRTNPAFVSKTEKDFEAPEYKEGFGFFTKNTKVPLNVTKEQLQEYAQKIHAAFAAKTPPKYAALRVVAVGVVEDLDGHQHLAYSVTRNEVDKSMKRVADSLGIKLLEHTPHTKERGDVGAPTDAEQILIFGAKENTQKALAIAPSAKACADCQPAMVSDDVIYISPKEPAARKITKPSLKRASPLAPPAGATPKKRKTAVSRSKSITQLIKYGAESRSALAKHLELIIDWFPKLISLKSAIDTVIDAVSTVNSAQTTARLLAGIELSGPGKAAETFLKDAKKINVESIQLHDALLSEAFDKNFRESLETTDRAEMLFVQNPLGEYHQYLNKIKPKIGEIIPKLIQKIKEVDAALTALKKLASNKGFYMATGVMGATFGTDISSQVIDLFKYIETFQQMKSRLSTALPIHQETLSILNVIEDSVLFFEKQISDRSNYLSANNLWTGQGISFVDPE